MRKEIETLFLAVQEIYSEKYKISEPSINLSLVHNILSKNIPNIQTKFEEIHCNNKKPHGIARKIINKIENLIKTQLANQNISFITIGSMADGNYIWEWSDYDAIIILNDEILEENNLRTIQSKIFNLRMILYYIDPFQDHGFFIFNSIHKKYYLNCFHAITSTIAGRNLFKHEIKIKKIDSHFFDVAPIFKKNDPSLNINLMDVNNYENYRLLLHRLYLAPSLLMQAEKKYLYKPNSIEEIDKYFKNDNLLFLSELKTIYKEFKFKRYYRTFLPLFIIKIFPFVIPYILRKWYSIISFPRMKKKKYIK